MTQQVIRATEAELVVHSIADINDVIGACFGADGVLLTEAELGPDFFNLRTGLAGELFQKFVQYHCRAAVVIPNPDQYGERFAELAYEHTSHPNVRFVRTAEDGLAWLSGA